MKAGAQPLCKHAFIDRLAEKTGLNKTSCEAALNGVIDLLDDCAKNREAVYIHGFGTFDTKDMPAREYNDPRIGHEGKKISKGDRVRLVFKPSKHLRDI